MQKFFELEELHPKDREWTNRSGNGRGAGAVSISGTYVWTPTDDDGDSEQTANNGVKNTTTAGSKSKSAAVTGNEASGRDEVDPGEGGAGGCCMGRREGGGGEAVEGRFMLLDGLGGQWLTVVEWYRMLWL